MTPDQRARRMVGYLPPVLQSGERIRLLFQTLARELGEMERQVAGLMRSRWYRLAQGFDAQDSLAAKADSELGRLGALHGVEPRSGEDAAYFRERIAAFVELHRTGLGSAPALLRLVSLVYMARQPPRISWEDDVAVGDFLVPTAQGEQPLRVTLADHPSTSTSARFRDITAGQWLPTFNKGLEEALPEITLTASGGDISIPVLHHQESGLDVLFLGLVPEGQTLSLHDGRTPRLDGRPVPDMPVLLANPTRFSDRDDLARRSRFDEDARFALFDPSQRLPRLLVGDNHWRYDTLSREDLISYLQGTPGLESALEAALALALPTRTTPPATLVFSWEERARATFALRIPAHYVPPRLQVPDQERQVPGLPGLVRELMAALNHGRAAGVRPVIELLAPPLHDSFSLEDRSVFARLDASGSVPLQIQDPASAPTPVDPSRSKP